MAASEVYQLKVTLKGARPPIWRRLLVTGDTSLGKLHHVIQTAFGWHDYHLHVFRAGGREYADPSQQIEGTASESRITLGRAAGGAGSKILYEYDFGDSWDHEILVEKVLAPEPGVQYPVCVTGKRHGPPEDVGGVWGYAEFLEAIGNPEHPEHDDLLDWAGGKFDPEAFDCDAVNQKLRRMR